MGTDIHMHYEVKRDGRWEYINEHPLYIYRNYDLFSILANVRNGYGFAGCETSTGFIPIAMPRGIPDDASEIVKEASIERGRDGHSHSYLLLEELLNYNWSLVVNIIGIVSKKEYETFKNAGKPTSWCGGVGGKGVVEISNQEMDELIRTKEETKKIPYTRVIWQQTYRESVGESWFETLAELRKYGDPKDVRLVFWFDN